MVAAVAAHPRIRQVFVLHKYVVRYSKEGDAKFISHLDFLRAIGRAMRRANLPLKYSEGFNPHLCLSFAQPLGVGIAGENEWFEVELIAPCDDIPQKLARVMPRGIRILEARAVERNRFSALSRADYIVYPENMPSSSAVESFLAQPEIVVEKKTKSGAKQTDIRPMIFSIVPDGDSLTLRVAAGSTVNLKPQSVMEAMALYIPSYTPGYCRYVRTALLDAENQPLY